VRRWNDCDDALNCMTGIEILCHRHRVRGYCLTKIRGGAVVAEHIGETLYCSRAVHVLCDLDEIWGDCVEKLGSLLLVENIHELLHEVISKRIHHQFGRCRKDGIKDMRYEHGIGDLERRLECSARRLLLCSIDEHLVRHGHCEDSA